MVATPSTLSQWAIGVARVNYYTSSSNGIPLGITSYPVHSEEAEGENIMHLYRVWVIDRKGRLLMAGDAVVAKDEADARFLAGVDTKLREAGLRPGKVTVYVEHVCSVEVDPEPKKVKLVKAADDEAEDGAQA